ncbi:hypothetical protein CLOP_g20803 [Closterium sp. NIES-67]|nr:hypothetical protein CLOP_g20803 [Closterium sp. NIES-67]
MRAATPPRLEGRAVVAGAEVRQSPPAALSPLAVSRAAGPRPPPVLPSRPLPQQQRAPNGPSGRAGTRRGRRGCALERRLARTAATLEGILERAGAGLLPSPPQQEPPQQPPCHTQPPFPPRDRPPTLPDQPAHVGLIPSQLRPVQPCPAIARGSEWSSLQIPPPPPTALHPSALAPPRQHVPPGGPYTVQHPAAHPQPSHAPVHFPPGYYDLHHQSLPAPQRGSPALSADTLPEWRPPSSWAGAAEWSNPQVGLYRGGGVVGPPLTAGPLTAAPAGITVPAATLRRLGHARRGTEILLTILASASSALGSSGGRSMAPYFPLQGCMEAAIDLAVEAARARPGPARGTGTDPHLLAALRQVSASIDSASAAGLVAGAVSTLQVLLSYQAELLEEAGLAAVAD